MFRIPSLAPVRAEHLRPNSGKTMVMRSKNQYPGTPVYPFETMNRIPTPPQIRINVPRDSLVTHSRETLAVTELHILASLTEAVALMALIAMVFGILERRVKSALLRRVFIGILFGFGATIAMMAQAEIVLGGLVDGGATIIGLSAIFGGPVAVLLAASMAGALQVFVIGGVGTLASALSIGAAAGLGLIWATICGCAGRPKHKQIMVAGAVISLQFLTVYALPRDVANSAMTHFYPLVLAAAIAGALVLNTLIERERQSAELKRSLAAAADEDSLTGLANRRRFEAVARTMFGDPEFQRQRSAFILLDVDRFKTINDNYGHAAGDKTLRILADTLRAMVRPTDLVARIGGEEFGILLRNIGENEAQDVAGRIIAQLHTLNIEADNRVFPVTASAGVNEFLPAETAWETVFRQTDIALYAAKRGGRDRFQIADLPQAA